MIIRSIITIWSILFVTGLSAQKPTVVCSVSMFSDMTHEIAGDLVDIKTIVPIGADPHLHVPTPSDANLTVSADLILVNGLTFEGWINELIENSGTRAEVDTITNGMDIIRSAVYKDSADPHAWMSAKNGLIYIENIKNSLLKVVPQHKSAIEENYKRYRQKIETAHADIQEMIKEIPPKKRVLITSHDAFAYYGREYGIQVEPILGVSTEADVQTSDIIRVSEVIKDRNIPSVFVESTINPKLMKQIAADNGAGVGGSLYADSLGEPDGSAGTYLDMLMHNTKTIVAGLTKETNVSHNQTKSDSNGKSKIVLILLAVGILAAVFLIFKLIRNG